MGGSANAAETAHERITMWHEESGRVIETSGGTSYVLDVGDGPAVVLLHGSGPGVTGGINWYRNIGPLSQHFRVIVPDLVGWGRTSVRPAQPYGVETWAKQIIEILEALDISRSHFVGNSLGARITVSMAATRPDPINRIVLMGGPSPSMHKTKGLQKVYSYTPDLAGMRATLRELFAYNPDIVDEAMVERRYQDSVRPGFQDEYVKITQAVSRELEPDVFSIDSICHIDRPTLVVHGQDDLVVPVECGFELARLIDGAELHVFSRCGHWAQIEHASRFNSVVLDFLRAGTS
jgi:2-hydroxymuconate-semialdehyde hydrolase